jgi:WD40 repeat protein
MSQSAIEIFFSYVHEDEALRDKLAKHLQVLQREGTIKVWHDRKITAGEDRKNKIDSHLQSADIILLLISSDFLNSDYHYDIELKRALERHESKEARVIPVILRAVDLRGSPFEKLSALPENGKAITSWNNEDEAFTNVVKGLRRFIDCFPADPDSRIGANPYKGLSAFKEGDRFFGRDPQIKKLWEKFRGLQESATRLLTIYGPSGSGKSSLARAGLIPELARQPLPGCEQARVVVLVPGNHPLESLTTVLARIATNDPTPVTKTREFAIELAQVSEEGIYDGLRRIADALPDIAISPLIVLVDQLEEVFTLCEDLQEREAFIGNLLCATADRSKRVSVILILRSDFLGATQKYSHLNQLIAAQGYLVAAMDEDGLREAIAKPAELAGHPLDLSTVNLLIEQTADREGALPLLQFALTQIWVGLQEGTEPAEKLRAIGGVGGALAEEAKRIYESLTLREQEIARRVFLGLVQLGEGTKDTRRRTKLERVIAHQDSLEQVEKVIDRFASPSKRLITLADDNGTKTVEVTHEALFDNWQQLKHWLNDGRDNLRFQRRLDNAVMVWEEHKKSDGILWRSPDLDLLKRYEEKGDMTSLQLEFLQAAERSATNQRRLRQLVKRGFIAGFVLVLGSAIFATYQLQEARRAQSKQLAQLQEAQELRVKQLAASAEALLATKPVEAQINAIAAFDLAQSVFVKFPNYSMPLSIQNSLLEAIRLTREENLLSHDDNKSSVDAVGSLGSVAFSPDDSKIVSVSRKTIRIWKYDASKPPLDIPIDEKNVVNSVAFNHDGTQIVSGSLDKTVRIWNAETGQAVGKPLTGHKDSVNSVAFSHDGTQIVSGSLDKTVRIWNAKTGKPITDKPLTVHTDSVASVAFSHDDTQIASGSHDNTIRIWDLKKRNYVSLSGHTNSVNSVAFSPDGTKIVSGSLDRTIKVWNVKNKSYISLPTGHINTVTSVAFNHDGTKIVSGSLDNTVRIWDAKTGEAVGKPLTGHNDAVTSVAFNHEGTKIVSASIDKTVRIWNANTKFFGHKFLIFAIAFAPKEENKVISGSRDKELRFWNIKTGAATEDRTLTGHTDAIYTVAFDHDGTSIISGGYKDELLLWNRAKGIKLKLTGHKDAVSSVSFSPDGTKIVSGSHDGTIRIWGKSVTDAGRAMKHDGGVIKHDDIVMKHDGRVYSVAFSSDGKYIASGGKDKTVRLWNISNGLEITRKPFGKEKKEQAVRSVVFGKDNETIISAGEDRTVSVWNTKTNGVLKGVGHDDFIYSIAFCSKKNIIVSGSRDKTLRLWNADTMKPSGIPLKDYTNEIQSVAFSPDCESIISSSRDDTLREWKTSWTEESLGTLLKDSCQQLQQHSLINDETEVAKAAKHRCDISLKK